MARVALRAMRAQRARCYPPRRMSEAHWRRTARATVELTAHFRRDEPGAALEKAGRITDLGMGGAFVHTQRPPTVGTRIVLTLSAPTA